MRGRLRAAIRLVPLALVLLVCAVVVPDGAVARTEAVLVQVEHDRGVALSKDVVWILAVGSDMRPGEVMTRTRADALQLVGINTGTGAATSIGIPRDSYVPIDGFGSSRINAAMQYGGPQLLAKTVGELIGIEPDYVFVTRFPFFEAMVDDIGGIDVDNPRYFYDENLKPGGFSKGRIHLVGYGAMAFARSRHQLPNGDFDRSRNQQRVLVGIQRKIASRAPEPGFIDLGVASVLKHTAADVGPAAIFRLAQAAAQIDPKKLTGCVLTGSFATVGGASVVMPYLADAKDYGDQVRKDAVLERCRFGPARR